jgi:glyoxylase I family protein
MRRMRPVAVHHVSLNVPDVDAGVAFYTRILGGVLRDDRPALGFDGAWIDIGAQQVHLLQGVVPADGGQHFAVQVEDLDEVVEELRATGLGVSDATSVGSGRQAFLHDPAGNLVELHQVHA